MKRFLVNYVICVGNDDRLLYSDRLHLYAKDRCYVSSRFKELLTASKVCILGPDQCHLSLFADFLRLSAQYPPLGEGAQHSGPVRRV